MKRFPYLSGEEFLEIHDYKFTPKTDITVFELALLTDAMVAQPTRSNSLLKLIIKKWPLPDICRHIEKRNTDTDHNFETEVREAVLSMFKSHKPSDHDSWWKESVNRTLIKKWLQEDEKE